MYSNELIYIENDLYVNQFTQIHDCDQSTIDHLLNKPEEFSCREFLDGYYIRAGCHNGKLWMSTWCRTYSCDHPSEWPQTEQFFIYREAHQVLANSLSHLNTLFKGNFEFQAVIVSNRKQPYQRINYDVDTIVILHNEHLRGTFKPVVLPAINHQKFYGLQKEIHMGGAEIEWVITPQRQLYQHLYADVIRRLKQDILWPTTLFTNKLMVEPSGLIFSDGEREFVLFSNTYATEKSYFDSLNVFLNVDEHGHNLVERIIVACERRDVVELEAAYGLLALLEVHKDYDPFTFWSKMDACQNLFSLLHYVNDNMNPNHMVNINYEV